MTFFIGLQYAGNFYEFKKIYNITNNQFIINILTLKHFYFKLRREQSKSLLIAPTLQNVFRIVFSKKVVIF